MTNPQFVEDVPLTLVETRQIFSKIEKRDEELSFRSGKVKDFLDHFASPLTIAKRDELEKKIKGLDLTRLKEIHIAKIIDFLPSDILELKTLLQSYPLSLPKKDQDAILGALKDFI